MSERTLTLDQVLEQERQRVNPTSTRPPINGPRSPIRTTQVMPPGETLLTKSRRRASDEYDAAGNYIPLNERGRVYQCQTCEDRGVISLRVPVDHPQFGQAVVCPVCSGGPALEANRQRRREQALTLLREAGLTETDRHAVLTWESFTLDVLGAKIFEGKETAVELAKLWAAGVPLSYDVLGDHPLAGQYPTTLRFRPTQSLWLHGSPGVGKTGLAYVAYQERLRISGKPGVFVEWAALYEAMKGRYGERGENTVYPLLEAVANSPVLILDDIGQQRQQTAVRDDEYSKLWQIVDQRYRHQDYETIITTNLDRFRLRDLFDDKLVGRLAETFVMVRMGGPQFREFDR